MRKIKYIAAFAPASRRVRHGSDQTDRWSLVLLLGPRFAASFEDSSRLRASSPLLGHVATQSAPKNATWPPGRMVGDGGSHRAEILAPREQ